MKFIYSIILILFSQLSFSQKFEEIDINEFYKVTLESYLSDIKNNDSNIYIKSDSNFILTTDSIKFNFVTKDQEYYLIKKHKSLDLYWIEMTTPAQDTIEMRIGGWSAEYEKPFLRKGYFKYGVWCGGTMGDISQGQFIYNRKNNVWTFKPYQQIVDEFFLNQKLNSK